MNNRTLLIQTILKRMSILLKMYDYYREAIIFDNASIEIFNNPEIVKTNLLVWYGGMGSLNDIVLQKNGIIPCEENEEFDSLRQELYILLKQL